jgi:hypothetical protein
MHRKFNVSFAARAEVAGCHVIPRAWQVKVAAGVTNDEILFAQEIE